MKFVLVNGRSPRPQSFCALCCESIGEGYLRETLITAKLSARIAKILKWPSARPVNGGSPPEPAAFEVSH